MGRIIAMQTLGSYIKEQRERRGWLQTELAARSGVPQATISAIETGAKKLPGADIRRKLARALGVPHIALLIAAGEVEAEEVDPKIPLPSPFGEDDPRSEVVQLLAEIDDRDASNVANLVRSMWRNRQQLLTADDPPAKPRLAS
jgi:transcriptional regulator with XRE-family HTH domain